MEITAWQFLLELLQSNQYTHIITWTDNDGEFKLLNAREVARMWGLRKNNYNMNYDKFSRSLRLYYKRNILKKVVGQKFVYRFISFPDIKNPVNMILFHDKMETINKAQQQSPSTTTPPHAYQNPPYGLPYLQPLFQVEPQNRFVPFLEIVKTENMIPFHVKTETVNEALQQSPSTSTPQHAYQKPPYGLPYLQPRFRMEHQDRFVPFLDIVKTENMTPFHVKIETVNESLQQSPSTSTSQIAYQNPPYCMPNPQPLFRMGNQDRFVSFPDFVNTASMIPIHVKMESINEAQKQSQSTSTPQIACKNPPYGLPNSQPLFPKRHQDRFVSFPDIVKTVNMIPFHVKKENIDKAQRQSWTSTPQLATKNPCGVPKRKPLSSKKHQENSYENPDCGHWLLSQRHQLSDVGREAKRSFGDDNDEVVSSVSDHDEVCSSDSKHDKFGTANSDYDEGSTSKSESGTSDSRHSPFMPSGSDSPGSCTNIRIPIEFQIEFKPPTDRTSTKGFRITDLMTNIQER